MNPTLILWLGGVFILILIGVGIYFTISGQKSEEEERIGDYLEPEVKPSDLKKAAQSPVTDWLTKRVEKSSYGDRIARDLARADLKFKPGEYVALMVISSFAVGVLGFFIGQNSWLLGAAGVVFGPFLPGMYVKNQQSKRLIKFNDQLADMLSLMVNSLRAGFSTLQAMEAVSKELPSPICDEFRRVVQEIQLGVTTEQALDNLLRRIPSDDLDLVITAMNVQREVGGNLAEILETISHTIRDRVRLKGEIRVLTSQMMYSGKFLSILPIALSLLLYVLNKSYIMVLVDPKANQPLPCGYIAIGGAVVLIVVGYIVMQKMATIEV
ncbi:MAG: type II secretion system F family protein [Anaerolineaceae bacterium]|nr:type II secretion system F family protein [Anaerolineaceae bacterium]